MKHTRLSLSVAVVLLLVLAQLVPPLSSASLFLTSPALAEAALGETAPPPEPTPEPAPAPEPEPAPAPEPTPAPTEPPAPTPTTQPPAPPSTQPPTPPTAQPSPGTTLPPNSGGGGAGTNTGGKPVKPPAQIIPGFDPLPLLPSQELLDTRSQLEKAKAELQARQAELDKLALEYATVENRLEEYQGQAARAREEAAKARQELAAIQEQLSNRLRDVYKSRAGYDAALVEAILGGDGSLNRLITRVDSVLRFLQRDKSLFDQVEEHVQRIEQLTAEIEEKESKAQEELEALKAAKEKALTVLGESKAEYNALREKVRVLEEQWAAEQRARGGVLPTPGTRGPVYGTATYQALESPGWIFPVQGPNSFINDWHFPRSGGRKHKGNDIMSARQTPLVAVVNGVISRTSPVERGLGGITVWLRGDDGNSYYYAHLESIAGGIVPGLKVRGGQVLGWVGDTGNARGGETHLHFEIHPGGGAAINPYPTLVKYR